MGENFRNEPKDTRVLDDDVPGGFVEDHLVEDVDDLAHKLVVLLLGCGGTNKDSVNTNPALLESIYLFRMKRVEVQFRVCLSPLSSSIRAGMIPDLASMAAHESSMDTVPIMITTSRIRSSSAEPDSREEKLFEERQQIR